MKIKTIQLVTKANEPNCNGHVFTDEVLKKMVDEINNRDVPLTVGYYNNENNGMVNIRDIVGMSIPGSAKIDGNRINVDFKLMEEAQSYLNDENNYTIGSQFIAICEDNIIQKKDLKIVHLAILPRKKCEVKKDDFKT